MDPKEILKRAKNPNHIPGIYNYCDRWCEKCPFTNRCLNRELTEELEKNLDLLDVQNTEFWSKMNSIYETTKGLIQEIIEKQGNDPNLIDENKIPDKTIKNEDSHKLAMTHKISIQAMEYSKLVKSFFESEEGFFQQKEAEFNEQLDLGLNEESIENAADEIKEAFDIINWYSDMVYPKIMRAISGKYDNDMGAEENETQSDSDGSAKVALIGIDRSLAAWCKLQIILPETTDELITILLHLDKLRKAIELEFPNARSFKRPGFDDKPEAIIQQ